MKNADQDKPGLPETGPEENPKEETLREYLINDHPPFEFPPIVISKDPKPEAPPEKVQMDPYQVPGDQAAVLKKRLQEIYTPGFLNTLLRRRMRQGVTAILKERSGREFAEGHWEYIAQLIINVFMAITDPVTYGKILTKEQIDKVKDEYPVELELLTGVGKMMAEGKSFDQIKSSIGFASAITS